MLQVLCRSTCSVAVSGLSLVEVWLSSVVDALQKLWDV